MSSSDRSAQQLDEPAERLIRILAVQIDRHRELLSCIGRKRQAIRVAAIDAMTATCQEEHVIVQQIGDLEKRRLEVIGRVTELVAPDAEKPLTLAEIARAAGQPHQRELEALAERLREAIGTVRRESSVVRAAAEALSRHMSGIKQTVNSALSRVGLYESRGRIAVGAQTALCVDMTS